LGKKEKRAVPPGRSNQMAIEQVSAEEEHGLSPAKKFSMTASPAKPNRKWRSKILPAAMLGLVAWLLVSSLGAQLLIVKSELLSADAIVVMSGSSTYQERTTWAARLYREGRAPVVILTNDGLFSGWNEAEQRNPYFYELAAKELRKQGVPADKIRVVSEQAIGTYEESLRVRKYASTNNLKRLLVVTSAYHSRRALWSMRRACGGSGIEVGIDTPPQGWQTPSLLTWWLHRWGWRVVAGEYAKLAYYKLAY
jgi:uncharacterized SAM-binding protein YcdF (DUF218 family)